MEGFAIGFCTLCALSTYVFAVSDGVYMLKSPSSLNMPLNDETSLTCEMNLQPDKFQWRHYPLPPSEASNPNAIINLGKAYFNELPPNMFHNDRKTSTLRLNMSSKAVAGDYQCLAYFGASVVASIPGRITLTTLEKFSKFKDTHAIVLAGNIVTWWCDPPVSNPPAFVEYYKNGNYINSHTSNTLTLLNVTTRDTGLYKCKAGNIYLMERQESNAVFNLQVVTDQPPQPPQFIMTPKVSYTVEKGKNVLLECSAVGNPIPKVTWFKNNGQIPPHRTEMLPGALRIKNISSSDEGTYICRHTNNLGTISHQIHLIYQEAPTIIEGPPNTDIKEGENLDIDCIVQGSPKPIISWFVNGRSVINDTSVQTNGHQIYFRPVQKRHAGILQCFATNVVQTIYSSADMKVFPKQISSTDVDEYSMTHTTVPNRKMRKHKNRGKHKNGKTSAEMIPPSKPIISRLSDESVMVRWNVPQNNGLPIQFFKVQYRELGPTNSDGNYIRKNSRWKTTNADIPPHIYSFEVNNLKSNHVYKFRIAAVYSNNDNKLSPNSDKFHLNRQDWDKRNPLPIPILTRTETINTTAIKIYWEYTPVPNISIDGFFVNYISATNAGDYTQNTVDGENARSYVITHLQPDTLYEIKIQSFTSKAASLFSHVMKAKTAPEPTTEASTNAPKQISDSAGIPKLYIIIVAIVIGFALIISIIVVLVVCRKWKQKKNAANGRGGDKPAVEEVNHHIQADSNDYVVSPRSLPRANGCAVSPNRITITANPLADADNKNQNMIEMSCLSSQNNNCTISQPSASNQESNPSDSSLKKKSKIKNRDKNKCNKNETSAPGENYV